MNSWFTELQTKDMALSCRVTEILHREKTPYQELAVYNTVPFGRMLVLDDIIQTTMVDEFVYHEMIVHVGLNTHPAPRRVLVIGGGDGGTIREVVKHQEVERAALVEIDGRVIEAARKFLPEISSGLTDPRVEIIVDDGISYVEKNKNTYEMIIIDSTDPIGAATGLFEAAFYRNVAEALTEDGLFVAQTESPFFNRDLIRRAYREVAEIFPLTRLYLANIPSYPGGLWTFTLGSKRHDPLKINKPVLASLNTKYYSLEVHKAAFTLPPFVAALTK
ncbi:MAG TPA: spermidine synthase [Desulfotomaculum sp.]|nr:spermidine synthase [Desulfotomaculum sp.]